MTRLALGQCKYLKAYHERLDCLLRNNQYSHLEEVRHNRFVRTYHGRTGKMALAHDEWHDKAPKGINNVIDEIMEYKPKFWSPISTITCLVMRTALVMMGRTTRSRK